MWHYLYRISDGALLSESSGDAPTPPDGCAVKSYDDRRSQTQDWDAASADFVARPIAVTVWTAKEFLQRFTIPEGAAILAASKTDATVSYLLTVIQAPGDVHADNPLLAQGLQYLVAAGLLTAERAAEIGGNG